MKQSTVFLKYEGDKWYARNFNKPREPDPVFEAIKALDLKPKRVLEIGCGNGWRLKLLREHIKCVGYGMDASKDAINDAPNSIEKYGIQCWRGTADDIRRLPDNSVDMVIYGFCLYVVDREDLPTIVKESDRILRDNGHIVIHDFYTPRPYSRIYEHRAGVRSYKQNYGLLWLGNPSYRLLNQQLRGDGDDQTAVTILKKNMAEGWPLMTENHTTTWVA